MDNKTIEKSIIKTYRKEIWAKFVKGVKEFKLVNEGDKVEEKIHSYLLNACRS